MAFSRLLPFGFRRGRASVSNEVCSGAGGTYTVEIQLDRDDYDVALVFLGIPNAAPNHRRIGAAILATRSDADSVAQSVDDKYTTIPGYPSGIAYTCYDFWTQWWSYSDDGKLSSFNFGAGSGTGNYWTFINRAWIDGDTLKVEMKNTHPSAGITARVDLEVEYRVWRTP